MVAGIPHPDGVLMVPSSGTRGDHVYMGDAVFAPVVDVLFGHEQIPLSGLPGTGRSAAKTINLLSVEDALRRNWCPH